MGKAYLRMNSCINFNQPLRFKSVFISALLLINLMVVRAQTTSDGQLWLDAELNYTHKKRYLFQNELSYQTLLYGGSYWYSLNSTPAFEFNLNPNFDLITAIPLSYTLQGSKMSTFEIRTMIGTRIYLTPTQRPQVRFLVRLEERWVYDNFSDYWDISNRIRLRAEFIYPLNRSSYFEDDMWYLIGDTEVFLTTNGDINERFANRTRFRAGIGYRLSYKLRLEGIYTLQHSRNTIEDDFNSRDNIIRLRLKYYFK